MAATAGLGEIAELMKRYLDEDSVKKALEVEGRTAEDALTDASIQLGLPTRRLEYEILERGNPGLFGVGRKNWRLRVYPAAEKREIELPTEDEFETAMGAEAGEAAIRDRDGECFVRLSPDGALVKVTAPLGRGKRVAERHVIEKLEARAVRNFDEDLIRELVRQASGEYIRVGDFITNPANDAFISVDVTDQEMKAFVSIAPPGPGGSDLSKEAIMAYLRNNSVIHGIKDELIQDLEDKPKYKELVLVAEGTKPINGRDAKIQFNFEIDKSRQHLKEASDGRVNFKELGLIQNVVAGQPLARKLPPEQGQPGRTVTGKFIPSKDGRDIPSPLGRNTHLSDDGATIIADINGQVTFIGGKINVEEVFTVPGDVDLKTGNIMFLGTVIVAGNVEDGFTVKASGNIEVHGNVGKCDIVAEGDIIVHQGITGKSGGTIQVGRNLWSKFIENATVEAGENVIVSDGIINSSVTTNKKIICQGKRASIVGGRYRACEEINAKALGSPVGGTETVLEVGYDPKSKEKMDQLQTQGYQIRRQIEEIDKNISTLNVIKKQRKTLPEEKEALLKDYIVRREEMVREVRSFAKEIETLQTYLNGLKVKGRISASGRIYPGVKLCIKDIREDIKTEMKAVTFYLENQMIRTTKYEEPEDEVLRRGPPDANTAY